MESDTDDNIVAFSDGGEDVYTTIESLRNVGPNSCRSESESDSDDEPLSRFVNQHNRGVEPEAELNWDSDGVSEVELGDPLDSSSDDEPLIRLVNAQHNRVDPGIPDQEAEQSRVQPDQRWTVNGRSEQRKDPFSGPRPGPKVTLNNEAKEIDFFLLFFPLALINLLVRETNIYAEQKIRTKPDPAWIGVTMEEMKAYLGIRIFMSVKHLPSFNMYWSKDWLFGMAHVAKVMFRDRFSKIMQYFHTNNRDRIIPHGQPGHDKLFLIRPVLDCVLKACLNNYNPHQNTSVDEAMVAFRGRLGFRQYLPAKPTKYGVKVWMRADPVNGYVNDFQVYTGREERATPETGLATRVVLDLTRHIWNRHHIVNMDNYFTSPDLLKKLLRNGTYGRGTIRPNRKQYSSNLFKKKDLVKRGDYKTASRGDLLACTWMDKKPTFFLSSADDPAQVDSTVIRKMKNGEQSEFPCPSVVNGYNMYMNGVDRADQMRTEYPSYRTSRRWWVYLFWFLFDTAVTNAFILMKESPNHQKKTKTGKEKKLTLLDFRMNLAKQLIDKLRVPEKKRPVLAPLDPNAPKHFPMKAKKGRCRECSKSNVRSEPTMKCRACNVSLCVECFEPYHNGIGS